MLATKEQRFWSFLTVWFIFFNAVPQATLTREPSSCQTALYVHFPKTGGSSIATILLAHKHLTWLPPEPWHWFHMSAVQQRQLYGPDRYADAFTFATVRNPFALMVSVFFMIDLCGSQADSLLLEGEHAHCRKYVSLWPTTLDDNTYHGEIKRLFEDWLLEHDQEPQFFSGWTLTDRLALGKNLSQHEWLSDENGRVIVKKVFRLEGDGYKTITSSPTALLDMMHCGKVSTLQQNPRTVHVVPQTFFQGTVESRHHRDPFFYYSQRTCEIVARRFAVDFNSFNYSVDECFTKVLRS